MTLQLSDQSESADKYCPKCLGRFDQAVEQCPHDGTDLRAASSDPLLGTTFANRYEILSVLGAGGMSIVYKARHKLINRIVAIKMLQGYLRTDAVALQRFKLEAQAASLLNHPNIVTIYDFGVSEHGEPFFVMDFLDGESLQARLKREGKIAFQEAITIFRQIAEAIAAAHSKDIIHRDLKPANIILLGQTGQPPLVKMLDFGLAKMPNIHLSNAGDIYGSPLYMSPEQCQGLVPDKRSDIYSLGCVMFEVISGQVPLKGENVLETMNLHIEKNPPSLSEKTQGLEIPHEFVKLVDSCLERNADYRPQTCEEIIAILIKFTPPPTITRGPKSKQTSSTARLRQIKLRYISRWAIALAFTLGIGLTIATFFVLWPGPENDPGTLLEKTKLQLLMDAAIRSSKQQDYQSAEKYLLRARNCSSHFDYQKLRLESILSILANVYNEWEGHAGDLERVNSEIVAIQDERIRNEVTAQIATLTEIARSGSSPVARENQRLRMEAQMPSIIALERKLLGRSFLDTSKQLLDVAINLGDQIMPENSPNRAELESLYGRTEEMARNNQPARMHFAKSCAIYRKNIHQKPLAYAQSLSQLGQFDVNRGSFTIAEGELKEALEIARRNKSVELEILTLRSIADLKRQTGKTKEAEAMETEANHLKTGLTPGNTVLK